MMVQNKPIKMGLYFVSDLKLRFLKCNENRAFIKVIWQVDMEQYQILDVKKNTE